ncbi:acyltransferase [Schumannella sp. 10F1B-5-1]|uniref:acyltransferase family protein n=1 Tax=Schumannella sp. 10F1B-5-1 TaxID=2590780 RepID=UPI0015E8336B|nr:acyltransferase [Schumannella sp. 10F1B-5-1]
MSTTSPGRVARPFRPRLEHSRFLTERHFGAFDGVRAIAAAMVVLFHFGGAATAPINGWLGVHLFFVLSGFLITTLLLREEARRARVSLVEFWIRRLFRIVPAYAVVLAIALVFVARLGPADYSSLPYYLSFSVEWAPPGPGLGAYYGHAWTIGIEQKFYLIWPVMAFVAVPVAFRRPAWRLGVITGLGFATIWFPGVLVHYLVIGFGCAIAVLMNSRRGFAVVRPLTTPVGGAAALSALIVVQIVARSAADSLGSEVPVVLAYGACAALAIPGFVVPSGFVTAVLSAAPLRWIGARSYSLYLIQTVAAVTVGQVIRPAHIGWGGALVALAASLLAADLIYRYVEQPMIRVGKRLVGRHRERSERDRGLTSEPGGGAVSEIG